MIIASAVFVSLMMLVSLIMLFRQPENGCVWIPVLIIQGACLFIDIVLLINQGSK